MENRRSFRANQNYKQRVYLNKLHPEKHTDVVIPAVEICLLTEEEARAAQYSVAEFTEMRERLNAAKAQMDPIFIMAKTDKDVEERWYQFNSAIDLYRQMKRTITGKYGGQYITNAWLKYHEIFAHHNLLHDNMRVFLNAELPGAAICALNHNMRSRGMKYDWRASSLAPDSASAENLSPLGDVLGLYAKYRDRWLMDVREGDRPVLNNGDATVWANIADWAARVGPNSEFGGVDLYSHDAGIGVEEIDGELGFNRQEEANAKIHLGCAIAGFLTMRKGATFIAKQYTFFETLTWNLILIYATLFDEFQLCKPLTSRPYNSEIYLVGKGFRGISDEVLAALRARLENFHMGPILSESCVKMNGWRAMQALFQFLDVYDLQIRIIDENVSLYNTTKYNLQTQLYELKGKLQREWFARYPLIELKPEEKL